MAVRRYNPTSPGRRFQTVSSFDEITRTKPERGLLRPAKKSGGRNNLGRITSRRRGGGHKRRYRVIDFKRNKDGVPAKVTSIEYDPNRSARVALLHYADGDKRYILAPVGLEVGDQVMSGPEAEIRPGNAMALRDMPLGMTIHNIELHPGHGGQVARGAGTSAQLLAREGKYAQLRLASGEMRLVQSICRATIGQVGNTDHENISIAFPILYRAKNFGAKKPIALWLKGPVVDGLRLFHLAMRPRANFFWRSDTNPNRFERGGVFGLIKQVENAVQRKSPSPSVPRGRRPINA